MSLKRRVGMFLFAGFSLKHPTILILLPVMAKKRKIRKEAINPRLIKVPKNKQSLSVSSANIADYRLSIGKLVTKYRQKRRSSIDAVSTRQGADISADLRPILSTDMSTITHRNIDKVLIECR